MMIMRYILSWFGYVKVPVEAVRISYMIQSFFFSAEKKVDSPDSKAVLNRYYQAAKTLTGFLRSGRFLE